MAYTIEYFRAGVKIGATPWNEPLPQTKQVARDGLIRHDADFARILDTQAGGVEVDSVRRQSIPGADENIDDMLIEAENARDNYDQMLRKLYGQQRQRPQILAQIERWRAELNEMLERYGRGKEPPRR